MVKVLKGSVRSGQEKYLVGATISGLSKQDEDQLIESGVCETVAETKSKRPIKNQEESDLNGEPT